VVSGLAAITPFLPLYERALECQRELQPTLSLSSASLATDYLAPFPVNIAGTAVRSKSGGFHDDPFADLDDTRAFADGPLPRIAAISGDGYGVGAHALLDTLSWGALATRHVLQRLNLDALEHAKWQGVRDVIRDIPKACCAFEVAGGHLFFVGEQGARATVAMTTKALERWDSLASGLRHGLDQDDLDL
jgi:hypothetical protein